MAKEEANSTGADHHHNHDPASFIKSRNNPRNTVRNAPFAGRIGGNQEFVVGDDQESQDILKRQPDAAPIFRFQDAIDIRGFLVIDTWRQAVIEGLGTCLLVFVVGSTASGLTVKAPSLFASTLYAGLINVVALSLFIFAAGPVSGGHLNPTITMSTLFAGLATLPRAVLYITAQATGAIVGGFWLRLGLGDDYFPKGEIPGCTITKGEVSVGEMFALEYMFAQALIFIAFGVGLDPRQKKIFGAALAPIFVGSTLALGTLASALPKKGYTGISYNPARCLGLMTAKHDWHNHWVHWIAPMCAAAVNGVFYHFFPPYVRGNKSMMSTNPVNAAPV